MGSFLPGCVWVLVIHAYDRALVQSIGTGSLFTAIQQVLSGDPRKLTAGTPYHLLLLGLAVVFGYAIKPLVMRAAEWCSRPESWYREGRVFRFPYQSRYEAAAYFPRILAAVERQTGLAATELPGGHQPFSACKRILRQRGSELTEETEHAEAEARMLGSLFLANVAVLPPVLLFSQWAWVLPWSLTTVGLGYAFRRAREREIKYCYLNFIIAFNATGANKSANLESGA